MTIDAAHPFAITKDQVAALCRRLHLSPAEVMAVAVEVITRDLENGTASAADLCVILEDVEQAERTYNAKGRE